MKLAGYEAKAFSAWKDTPEDFDIINFATVANRSGIDISKVRRAVRGLARKGLTKFYRVSWTDEGEVHGAGYGLTKAGRELLAAQEVAA